jgi:hypothetical protein
MLVWSMTVLALGSVALYTVRAGRLYWQGGFRRGAVGTWLLALSAMALPLWFLWWRG